MLTSGGVDMAETYASHIMQHCLYSGAPRVCRLAAYKVLRHMASFFILDWNEVIGLII